MSTNTNFDLEAATTPQEVPDILRVAAQRYYESAIELEGAWQDKYAGSPWEAIAKELEAAASRIEKRLAI